PESLTCVSSSGCSHLPPSCITKAIGESSDPSFSRRLFSPPLAHCQQYQSRHLSYCCTAANKKPPVEEFQWRLGL
ncbi:hypothetical protein, partial [Yersinia mollaretii]|uniref:hypothetical protein n=1 Tax=Yersinia mollaretii TaxID=33060 RepID=UPI001E55CEC0